MGYVRHHAIIVTSTLEGQINPAYAKAVSLKMCVTPIVQSPVNGYLSFLVAPDGSKEGWEPSESGDKARANFLEWLDKQRYEDGSTSLAWVEVQYGDDEGVTCVTGHSDEEWRYLAYRTES